MTVKELMEQVDRLHPNQFSTADKLRWLNQIEQTIWNEIIMTHRGPWNPWEMPEYSSASDETVLLAVDPYSKLYLPWMDAQIFRNNKEGVNYQISAQAFSEAYQDFQRWYNRTHMPVGQVNHLMLTDRGWGAC